MSQPQGIVDAGSCRLSKPSSLISKTSCTQLKEIHGKVCACDAIDVPQYLSTFERDFNIHPIPPKDTRCIVFELERPAVREIPNDETADDKKWPDHLLERLRRLPESKQLDIKRALLTKNGSIVEVNYAITSVLANKYGSSVTVINDALKHVRIHRSEADDSGTSQRTATHFLQRVINSLTGKIELSATQAAAHLLKMPSFLSSTTHCFCFYAPQLFTSKK
jgi:hypothetical protein